MSALYSYRRATFRLDVYRDRIEVRERVLLQPTLVTLSLRQVRSVRCQSGGRLLLELSDRTWLVYQLGSASADVCALLVRLL